MSEESLNRLRRARELVRDALRFVEESAGMVLVANDALRESLTREIQEIKLSLSVMNRELTVFSAIVNRRKPRKKAQGHRTGKS